MATAGGGGDIGGGCGEIGGCAPSIGPVCEDDGRVVRVLRHALWPGRGSDGAADRAWTSARLRAATALAAAPGKAYIATGFGPGYRLSGASTPET